MTAGGTLQGVSRAAPASVVSYRPGSQRCGGFGPGANTPIAVVTGAGRGLGGRCAASSPAQGTG